MSAQAHAVKPPVHVPAPPLQQAASASAEQAQEVVAPITTSLSAIPAVQRRCAACEAEDKKMPVQPRLTVGPVNDPHEKEADSIAGEVMAMRDPAAASGAGASLQRVSATEPDDEDMISARPVRRAMAEAALDEEDKPRMSCACANDNDRVRRQSDEAATDEEEEVRMRAGAQGGGESIAASSAQLTSGGAALPAMTQSFFETRMGRDLSDVRVHQGSEADSLNRSIGARAFTYQNHIWLSRNERAEPNFTMAHEMAHVLQQTRPGPVGPQVWARRGARAAPPRVQRNLWQPLFTKSARKHSEATHNRLQKELVAENTGLVTEVRIPGAMKGRVFPWACGYADLYMADPAGHVPGAEAYAFHKGKDAAGVDAKLYHFRKITRTGNCGGSWRNHNMEPSRDHTDKYGFPTVTRRGKSPLFGDCAKGPTNIRLGDVKPGHNDSERAGAKAQIENYKAGILATAKRLNVRHKKTRGTDCWNPTVSIMSSLTIPGDWDPNRTGGWDIPSLEFRQSDAAPAKSYRPYGKNTQRTKGTRRIRGRYSAVKDPKYTDGVWVYFVEPEPGDLNNAMAAGKSGDPAAFKKITGRLGKVLGCLKSTPATSAKVCRRPTAKRAAAERRIRATAAPRRAMRKVKPGKMKKVEDKFNLDNWNAMRKGAPAGTTSKHSAGNLKETLETGFTEEQRDRLSFQGAVAEGEAKSRSLLGSHAYSVPAAAKSKASTGVIAQGKLLDKAEFWTGTLGGVLGKLRQKMGKAFGKTVELWDKFKKKASETFGKTKLKDRHSSALAVAAKGAASQVLKTIGTVTLRKTAGLVMGCLEQGVSAYMTKLLEKTPLPELYERASNMQADVDTLKDEIFGDLQAKATTAIGPLATKLDEISKLTSLIAKVVGVATTIAQGLRIATCLSSFSAGGVGGAVGCLAAAGDFVLSLFNASPIDYIVGKLIKSCKSRRLLAKAMLAFDSVANLPTTAARAIVKELRAALPPTIQDVFCKPEDIQDEKIKLDDVKCNDGAAGGWGSGYGSGTVTGEEGGGPASGKGDGKGSAKEMTDATEPGGGAGKPDAPENEQQGGAMTPAEQGKVESELTETEGTGAYREGVVYIIKGLSKSSATKQEHPNLTLELHANGYEYRVTNATLYVNWIEPKRLVKGGPVVTLVNAYFPSDKPSTFETTEENVPEQFRIFQVEKGVSSSMMLGKP